MIKIADTPAVVNAARLRKKNAAGGSDGGLFDDLLSATGEAESAAAPEAAAAPAALSSVASLLSLQEVPEQELRRQQALHHSRAAVEALDALRRELLFGDLGDNRLPAMQRQLAALQSSSVDDPRLQEVMSDIELRLAVEIAKRERGGSL